MKSKQVKKSKVQRQKNQENLTSRILNVGKALLRKPSFWIVSVIFLFEIFLRTYQINIKNPFGYDQVDNAWAAKNIVVNHWFPLVGMVAKADSGVYIGPLYYYFISIFYWLFNLNPIASQAVAVVSSIFTFFVLYYVIKKLFSTEIAIIALLINTFNYHIAIFDGIQWPVQLLPAISLIIFYLLYRVILGEVKKIIPLAIFVGIAFNLHFTAIFFPIIIILSLPLFPRTKETLKYILLGIPFFLVWLVPNIIYSLTNKTANSTATSYFSTYFHGFHLVRMKQLLGDALIQFNPYLLNDKFSSFKVILLPLFFIVYLFKQFNTERKKFAYLVFLWFIIPWIVFTTYSGEISDYYFVINRFIVLIVFSYFLYILWNFKYILAKSAVVIFLAVYCYIGFTTYLPYKDEGSFYKREQTAMQAVYSGKRIEFQQGVPESYLYWYYMRTLKGINVYK